MSWHASMRAQLEGDLLGAARALLGVHLVHGELRAQITEVEAYGSDPGSHAARGITPRTTVMFGPAGHCYTYFTYGSHWMLNVTSQPVGVPGALLIRAARPLAGHDVFFSRRPKATDERELLSGPGKLAQALGLSSAQYGHDLLDPSTELRLDPGVEVSRIMVGPRIGLAKGKGDDLPWRFVDQGAVDWVSRPVHSLLPM